MVGLAGFEPATSRPPDERATRLRYSPTEPTPRALGLRRSDERQSLHRRSGGGKRNCGQGSHPLSELDQPCGKARVWLMAMGAFLRIPLVAPLPIYKEITAHRGKEEPIHGREPDL